MDKRRLLDKHDEMVGAWVADRLPGFVLGTTPYTAIGTMQNGVIVGGVIYDNYTKTDIHMHCAGAHRRWLTRHFLGEAFRYPFTYLQCQRVTAAVRASNEYAREFHQHVGFVYEGTLRCILPNGEDLCIYGMLQSECRWLNIGWKKHGRSFSGLKRVS